MFCILKVAIPFSKLCLQGWKPRSAIAWLIDNGWECQSLKKWKQNKTLHLEMPRGFSVLGIKLGFHFVFCSLFHLTPHRKLPKHGINPKPNPGVFFCTLRIRTLGFGPLNYGMWPFIGAFGIQNLGLQTLRVHT